MPWRKEIEEYLDEICSHVKYKRDRQAIREEIGAHINERIWDLKHDGLNEEEAVARAIESMGDADSIGISLNKVHNPILGWIFYITNMAAKLVIGLVIVLFTVSLISEIEPFKPGNSKDEIVYEKKLNLKGKIDDTGVKFKKVILYKDGDVWIELLQYPTTLSALNNNSILWGFEAYTDDGEIVESKSGSERGGMFYNRSAISFNAKNSEKIVLDYDKYNRKMRVEIPLTGEEDE
ncbi:MAG: permease prefix domain 1-containing protein [Clostridium sp.]|uniref:permease prefix domain 1-containing protein n=1 Tax=Clostridium sp. TaxID=1506 RepID=UPI002A8D8FC0|nr:permease prefix domain 1-containing protein [Clostridium sp.]MDY5098816.1 permease prefix domain 1-containing protein [Clostridium sp.]